MDLRLVLSHDTENQQNTIRSLRLAKTQVKIQKGFCRYMNMSCNGDI